MLVKTASGNDEIPFHFLKAPEEPIHQALAYLTNTSMRLSYMSRSLKEARNVLLWKPGEEPYEQPNSWRPIALLKTNGKIVEKVLAKRIKQAAEKRVLLPPIQMGARAQRSTETAIELLTSMIHTIWRGRKDQVATLLSLEISSEFVKIVHETLVAIMKRMGYLPWIQKWVESFLQEFTFTQ